MQRQHLQQAIKLSERIQRKLHDEEKSVEAALQLVDKVDRLAHRQTLLERLGISEVGGRYRFAVSSLPNLE